MNESIFLLSPVDFISKAGKKEAINKEEKKTIEINHCVDRD